MFESTGREHDTAAGPRLERSVRPFDEDAGHPAVVGQQSHPAAPGLRLHAAVEAALEQATDERLSGSAFVAELAPA